MKAIALLLMMMAMMLSLTKCGKNADKIDTAGTTTDFTVSIADQSSKMPVLALGSVMFDHEITQYSCELYNQCGLVKFVTSFATSTTVTVEGMSTIASVSIVDWLYHTWICRMERINGSRAVILIAPLTTMTLRTVLLTLLN